MKINRFIFLSFMFFLLVVSVNAQKLSKQKHELNAALRILKYDKDLKNAGIGFIAIDINTGEILASHNSNLALTPASTQKLITTATALEIFGPGYRFETRVEYTGKIDLTTNILDGNIIIRGGGDPTLGSKYFVSTATHSFLDNWTKATLKKGIKYINGNIIADARIYGYDIVPPTWSWEDIGNYFGAGACGLSVYDNFYTLYFNTGSVVGSKTEIVKIEPKIEGMTFENHVKSDAVYSDRSYIFGAPYTYSRYISGELPLNRKEYKVKGSIPDPAYYTATELKKKLKIYNVSSGTATSFRKSPELTKNDSLNHTLIYITKSPKLIEIIGKTNFRSINLFAEHMYKHSQLKACNFNVEKIDKSFTEKFWAKKGVNTGGMNIYDGSGLSKYNTITAKQMAAVLMYMKTKSKYAENFYNSIPVVGKDGTVRRICRGTSAENNMHAKSGSIKNVRAYAGYVTTKSGREVAFSLLINNYNGSSTNTRKKMEKLMAAIADFNL
ncbi:MAG: D-alanyl-D-alanine carboxypeptidase/D-alanyl-D-alanine-endopeptidase [Bacteroidales bacterium]|nr:D-alanyl-D-alanine carboxypeptidase/D-alanyl-D-alanine-endopeptidase [Bacteroidales bacterium]